MGSSPAPPPAPHSDATVKICDEVAATVTSGHETPIAKAFCAEFDNQHDCTAFCDRFCKQPEHECHSSGAFSSLDGFDDVRAAGAPAPPHRRSAPGNTSILPILIVGFFGCFMYHTWAKHKQDRGRSQGMRAVGSRRDYDSEGINLVESTYGRARSFVSNRANDIADRRRDERLTANDYSRNPHDPDEDGML